MSEDRYADFIRLEPSAPPAPRVLPPLERMTHLIRPSKSGAPSHGLRTLCGLGRGHQVWRVTIQGAAVNVNGDGWSVCAACAQRARPLLARELKP